NTPRVHCRGLWGWAAAARENGRMRSGNLHPGNEIAAGVLPNREDPITEIDVLWITAGLGCDGDTIAMTAATQPSLEDIVGGALPWIPRVNFINLFLAFEIGDEFMRRFHLAAECKLAPFILVVEGSIPDES